MVLLDEIEKAAPEIFDILLGMLDEGRLTDRFGRVTIFRSAIIILTSNLGSTAPAAAGFGSGTTLSYESEAAKFFRPEFFNRLDAVITFNPLTPADVERITRKELAEIASREGLNRPLLNCAGPNNSCPSSLAKAMTVATAPVPCNAPSIDSSSPPWLDGA